MSDAPPERTSHLLAMNIDRSAVLVEDRADGTWQLPRLAGISDLETHPPVAGSVERYLGRPHPALRVIPLGRDEQRRATDVVVEVEPLPRHPAPPGRWMPLEAIRVDDLATIEPVRRVVARRLEEARTGRVDRRRQSWAAAGFQERARRWMTAQLAAAGTPALGEPWVASMWAISSLLRAETSGGPVFFKACARVFTQEPAIVEAIARVAPEATAEVVAVDHDESWLLTRDAGGEPLGEGPAEGWTVGLEALGSIQRIWAALPDPSIELENRGPVSNVDWLSGDLAGTVGEHLVGDLGARFRAAVPRLIEACHRLGELAPARTVVHGDYHPWNVHRSDGRTVIIDWSDAALGHPFQDLPTYLNRTADAGVRRDLLDAYLAGWPDHPRDELEEAARLGLVVGSLQQVESYRRIIDSLEPDEDWALAGGLPYFARWALAWLESGLEAQLES